MLIFRALHRTVSSASAEAALRSVPKQLEPTKTAHRRIAEKIQQRIAQPQPLARLSPILTPDDAAAARIWSRILGRINPVPDSLWDRVRSSLLPDAARFAFPLRLQPVRARVAYAPLKWVAALSIIALVVVASPALYLAPHSVAESRIVVTGDAYLLYGGLWQPNNDRELVLQGSAFIQTSEYGTRTIAAKILDHDDAVIRFAPGTTIAFHDTSNRPQAPSYPVTLTLHKGTIWVQGFVPAEVKDGITVAVGDSVVTLHEGSVSVSADGHVQVWNRHAVVAHGEHTIALIAGEEYAPGADGVFAVRTIDDSEYDRDWAHKNLAYDAVHQREIALLQQQRRAAQAGILPTSVFYPVKRAAEAVSVALSFTEEQRAKRLMAQANTRLNEAAALIAEGSEAGEPLKEYRETILAAASGSTVAQEIVEQELATAGVDIAASLPGDDGYELQKTVLETQALAVPESQKDVAQELIEDQLLAAQRSVQEGNTADAQQTLEDLQPVLEELGEGAQEFKEAQASLSVSTTAFAEEHEALRELVNEPEEEAPRPLPVRETLPLADRDAMVGLMLGDLQALKNPVSICNQSVTSLRKIQLLTPQDQSYVIGRIIRDGDPDYAGTFRVVWEQWKQGGQIDCRSLYGLPDQPEERVF